MDAIGVELRRCTQCHQPAEVASMHQVKLRTGEKLGFCPACWAGLKAAAKGRGWSVRQVVAKRYGQAAG